MSFLERINGAFQNYLETEYEQAKKTYLFGILPFIKLALTILYLVTVNYIVDSYIAWSNIFLIFTLSSVCFRLNLKRYFKLVILIGLIFPVVVSFPLIFLTPGSTVWSWNVNGIIIRITDGGLIYARDFIIRMMANISVIAFFILSTPFSHIIHVLKQIRIPSLFITMLVLTYRYFFLTFEQLVKILRAEDCRRSGKYTFKKRFSHLGTIFGMLLLRSIKRGERVQRSMMARGFSGTLPVLKFKAHHWYSILYLTGYLSINLIIIFIFI